MQNAKVQKVTIKNTSIEDVIVMWDSQRYRIAAGATIGVLPPIAKTFINQSKHLTRVLPEQTKSSKEVIDLVEKDEPVAAAVAKATLNDDVEEVTSDLPISKNTDETVETSTEEDTSTEFICDVCGKSFDKESSLRAHKRAMKHK